MSASNSSARNFVPMANKYERVVLLVDMDCFYCQVEEKLDPSLKNQPLAVVQYNAWKGGGIIAVNYAARDKGVTRHMRGDEAKEQCPEIKLVKVPNVREKADLTKYREAGKEVANVLQRFTPLLERASVDEAYLDITDVVNKRFQEMNNGTFILQPQELVNTYAVGFQTIGEFVTTITTSFITSPLADDDKFYRNFNENDVPAVRQSNIRLLIGASIASEIRSAVKAETSYECSAGIAHNKILAKLACGINKPNKQTILPLAQTPTYFETLPIGKIKGLGAKFGEEVCERLSVRYLGQLLKFTETELQRKFDEKNGTWLYNICRGIDLEAVTPRFYSKSIGCCKKFPGRNNITGIKTLQHWLNELANEINERLEKDICENNRRAKQMVVNFIQEFDGEEISSSRSAPLQSYETVILANNCLEIIKANTKQFFHFGSESVLNNPIKFLGLTVGKFETISNSQNNIQEMFAQQAAKKQKVQNDCKDEKASPSMSSTSGTNMVPVLDTEPGYFPTQMAKEKNTQNIKSFFLNAFKKDQNRDDVKPKTNLEQLDPTKLAYKKAFTPNELQISRSDICSDSVKQTAQKSFFVRALKINEKTKEVAASDFTSKQLDTTRNCNEKQTLGTNNGICNELNGLIDDINTIQNKENENNFEPMNENKNSPSSNNVFTIALSTANSSNIELSNNEPESKNISISMKRNYDKMSDTDELNGLDYRFRYAEFAVPEFRPEFLQFTNCSKCGTKIVNNPASLQTHQDHHYAQELSQQQRHEFREKIRTKIMSSKSPPINTSNKKSKKSQLLNNSVKKTNADITKFLTSSSTTIPSVLNCEKNQVPESNISTLEICNICKLPFKIVEMSEHKDFHVAKDLHRKLNQLEVQTVEVVQKLSSDLSRKTMNSSLPSPSRKSKVNAKPITHFLTKSNM